MQQIRYYLTKAQIGSRNIWDDLVNFPLQKKLWTIAEVLGERYEYNEIVTLGWQNETGSTGIFKKQMLSPTEILIPALASPCGFYCLVEGEVCDLTSQPISKSPL